MSLCEPEKFSPGGSSWFASLPRPLPEDQRTGWRAFPVFHGRTRCMMDLGCHVSVLSPETSPHEPHKHREEELLILLSGEADLLLEDDLSAGRLKVHEIGPGFLVYYPAGHVHSLRSTGTGPAEYLMFKWRNTRRKGAGELNRTSILSPEVWPGFPCGIAPETTLSKRILGGSTRFLENLQCDMVVLPPHSDVLSFRDGSDTAVLVLQGEVTANGRSVPSTGLVFFACGEPKEIRNSCQTPVSCLVFHFQGAGTGVSLAVEGRRLLRQGGRIKKKLFG